MRQGRLGLVALGVVSACTLAACGGHSRSSGTPAAVTSPATAAAAELAPVASTSSPVSNGSATPLPTSSGGSEPPHPSDSSQATSPIPAGASTPGSADEAAIRSAHRTFLYVLSGLDANLNASWVEALSKVATKRLAQAVVRQASAILHAGEHGVGVLVGHNLTIRMTGANTAAVADCEDYRSFYLVDSKTNQPDPAIVRGYFVGTTQLVKVDGKWLVDVFATTHATCKF